MTLTSMEKAIKRDRKLSWVHYSEEGNFLPIVRDPETPTTLCGKTSRRRRATKYPNCTTCPLCIEALKDLYWHCSEHGFLDDVDVTFEETCEHCGRSV